MNFLRILALSIKSKGGRCKFRNLMGGPAFMRNLTGGHMRNLTGGHRNLPKIKTVSQTLWGGA